MNQEASIVNTYTLKHSLAKIGRSNLWFLRRWNLASNSLQLQFQTNSFKVKIRKISQYEN